MSAAAERVIPKRRWSSHGPQRSRQALVSKVDVIDNQVDAALKQLKKLMLKDGAFQEMKRRAHYEKPSVKRKRKAAAARKKRRRALARTRAWDGD